MTQSLREHDVSIVGAGPVGCLLAIGLAKRGLAVGLYEGRPDPRASPPPPGRSINLTLAERGWAALREQGLDAAVREIAIPLRGRMIHGEDGSKRFQPYGDAGESLYSVSRARLHTTLLDLTRDVAGIDLRFNHRCRSLDLDTRELMFDRPEGGAPLRLRRSTVIAADGAHSTIRRTLLRLPHFTFVHRISPYQYKELGIPAAATGNWELEHNALHLWPRGEHMLVAFPNADRSMTCSLFMPFAGPDAFTTLSTREQLEAFFDRLDPALRPLMPDLCHDFFSSASHPLMTGRYAPWIHEGWLALIGDSAHSMVPFLGQGLNAGFEDCSVLLGCHDRHGGRWPEVFADYEALRRENCDAATELAERHYEELAKRARDPQFITRKALEQRLHRLAPERFVPLYHQISFQHVPYATLRDEDARQRALLDRIMARPDFARAFETPGFDQVLLQYVASL